MSQQEDGRSFDPFRSEFVDARFNPPKPKTLEEIQRLAEAMLIYTPPHAVLERPFFLNGKPALLRKHIERKSIDKSGDETEFPFAEAFLYDGYGDRLEDTLTINDDGSVYSTPGFLDGVDWRIDATGKLISPSNNWPGFLDQEDVETFVLLGLKDVISAYEIARLARTTGAPLITHAVDLAVESGIRTSIRNENVPLRSSVQEAPAIG